MLLCGIDEVGRGCLAGPVVSAAVVLKAEAGEYPDSKKVSHARRLELVRRLIDSDSLVYGLGFATVEEIDQHNILQATFLAMKRAHEDAQHKTENQLEAVVVDGNQLPKIARYEQAIVGGDRFCNCIGAASILAKVFRDQWMVTLEEEFPGYGFARHKGYGTAAHLKAIDSLGVLDCHRRSFKPIHDRLVQGDLFA